MSKQNRRVRKHYATGELLVENEDIYVNMRGNAYTSDKIIDKKVRIPKELRMSLEENGIKLYNLNEERNNLMKRINEIDKEKAIILKKVDKIEKYYINEMTEDEFIENLKKEIIYKFKGINQKNLNIKINEKKLVIAITNNLNTTDTTIKQITRVKDDEYIIDKSTPEARYKVNLLLENARTFYNPEGLKFKEKLLIKNYKLEYKLEKTLSLNAKLNNELIEKIMVEIKKLRKVE